MTQADVIDTAPALRPQTQAAHIRSVKRVIAAMRKNLWDPYGLSRRFKGRLAVTRHALQNEK